MPQDILLDESIGICSPGFWPRHDEKRHMSYSVTMIRVVAKSVLCETVMEELDAKKARRLSLILSDLCCAGIPFSSKLATHIRWAL